MRKFAFAALALALAGAVPSLSGRTAHMTGTAHVLRTDFGVGQGTAAAPVSRDVTVSIDLTASK